MAMLVPLTKITSKDFNQKAYSLINKVLSSVRRFLKAKFYCL